MNKQLQQLLKVLSSFLPRRLPIGMKEFESWVYDIIRLSKLPDNASTRRVAALFILQVPPQVGYMSIRRVSNMLIKAASNQVASDVIKQSQSLEGTSSGPKEVSSPSI